MKYIGKILKNHIKLDETSIGGGGWIFTAEKKFEYIVNSITNKQAYCHLLILGCVDCDPEY